MLSTAEMALDYKFIIFIIFITIRLIKTHDGDNIDSHFSNFPKQTTDSNEKEEWTESSTMIIPTDEPCSIQSLHTIFIKLSNSNLQRINDDFIISNGTIDLNLENNNIKDISPFAFHSLQSLLHINLSGNSISRMKLLSLIDSTKLQTLIIDNNRDNYQHNPYSYDYNYNRYIVKDYKVLKNLKHLYLRNNQLRDLQIPFYLATPVLSHLHLTNNSIKSSNVVFDNIPATLTHLYLDSNMLNRVEQNKLRYLQELVMDNNVITKVCFKDCRAQSISLRGAVQMQNLSLSKNLISEISEDAFSDTKYLMNLDLSGNTLAYLPNNVFNNTVLMISLSLANNILITTPDICSMPHLTSLDLSGNNIHRIHSDSFCSLKNLEYLFLARNNITTIESEAFLNLETLKYLDISGNKLSQLPALWVFSSLQELHLEQNGFTNLNDASLVNIQSLRNVYLDKNPITSLKVEHFQSLPENLTIHLKNMR